VLDIERLQKDKSLLEVKDNELTSFVRPEGPAAKAL
jgi:hypothetical protein